MYMHACVYKYVIGGARVTTVSHDFPTCFIACRHKLYDIEVASATSPLVEKAPLHQRKAPDNEIINQLDISDSSPEREESACMTTGQFGINLLR